MTAALSLAIALGLCFSGADTDPKTRAQELIASGNEFYAKKEYQAAIALFERAYAVYPSPIIFYNIAKAHRVQGNLLRAAEYYEKFLSESDAKPGSERHELASADLRELENRLGRISISGAPDGAETRLDGQVIDPARSSSIRVLPGEHEITSTLADHDPFKRVEQVAEGATVNVEIALVRALPAAPAQIALTPPVEPEVETTPVTGEWWFWALIAGGAAIATGAAIAVATRSEYTQNGELERSSTGDWESF